MDRYAKLIAFYCDPESELMVVLTWDGQYVLLVRSEELLRCSQENCLALFYEIVADKLRAEPAPDAYVGCIHIPQDPSYYEVCVQ